MHCGIQCFITDHLSISCKVGWVVWYSKLNESTAGLFGKFVKIKITSTWQFRFPEPNTHLVNCETLKLFIEGPCKGHWCGSWSNKAQLLWSHLLQLSNRGFLFLVVNRLFIWRNSSALVWLFWWFLWNRKAVSGECVSPHTRRVYKWVITNFSPTTMVLLLVRIYTGNNLLISTVLCCSNTGLNNKHLENDTFCNF